MQAVIKYSEQELVMLLQQRNQQAFSYLYDNYAAAINGIITSIVDDVDVAADVLQEVFIKIWKQIETYDSSKGRLFTWMLNIARNASIDMIRSKAWQNSSKNIELEEKHYDDAGTADIKADIIGLKKLVYSLKEEYKILVELAYFKGYTQDEIAKMLQIPLGTVKTRLRAALIQLKQQIN